MPGAVKIFSTFKHLGQKAIALVLATFSIQPIAQSVLTTCPQPCYATDSRTNRPRTADSTDCCKPDDAVERDRNTTTLKFEIPHLIAMFELETLGKTYPAWDQMGRLSRIEKDLFEQDYDGYSHSVQTRLQRILDATPPSADVVFVIKQKLEDDPKWFEKSHEVQCKSSIYRRTAILEKSLYGDDSPHTKLHERIKHLKHDYFGDKHATMNLREVSDEIMMSLKPPEDTQPSTPIAPKLTSTFRNSMAGAGKTISKLPGRAASGLGKVLTSPTFWTLVVDGAIIYGVVEMARRGWLPTNTSSSGEGRCIGEAVCNHCSSCNYCQYCNSTLSHCGVYTRTRGYAPAIVQSRKPAMPLFQSNDPSQGEYSSGFSKISYLGSGDGHWIDQNTEGKLIKLEDGSIWAISMLDQINTLLWLPISNITVIENGDPFFPYTLINTDDGEKAAAKFLTQ